MKPYHIIKRNTADLPFRLRKNINQLFRKNKNILGSTGSARYNFTYERQSWSKEKPSCLAQKGSFTLKINLKLQPIKFAFTGIFLYLNVSDHWAVVLPTGTFDLNSS